MVCCRFAGYISFADKKRQGFIFPSRRSDRAGTDGLILPGRPGSLLPDFRIITDCFLRALSFVRFGRARQGLFY